MYRVRAKYFESWIKRNGTGDLDCRRVICLFMRVSIARGILRESRFPRDYLGAALRHIARYRHILHARGTSSRVFARPGTGSAVTPRAAQARFWSSGHHRIPRRRLSQRERERERVRSERCLKPPPRVPVIKDVGRNVLSRFSSWNCKFSLDMLVKFVFERLSVRRCCVCALLNKFYYTKIQNLLCELES